MDKAMANAQVYVVQFFGAPLPDEPRRRFFLFSSLAAIYDKFSAAQVGCSLGNLYNLRVSDGMPYCGKLCMVWREPLYSKRRKTD